MGPGSGEPGAGLAASEGKTRPVPLRGAPGGAPNEGWDGTPAASRAANGPPPVRGGTGTPGGTGLPSPARPVVRRGVPGLPRVGTRAVRTPGPRPTGCRWASPLGSRPRAGGLRDGRRAGGGAKAARDHRHLPRTPPPAGPGWDPRSGTAPARGRTCRRPRQRQHPRELDPPPAGPGGRRVRRPRRPRPRRSAPQGPVTRSSEPDGGAGSCGGIWARTRPVRRGETARDRFRRPCPGRLPGRPAHRPCRNRRLAGQPAERRCLPAGTRPTGAGALPLRGPGRWNEARAGRRRHRRGHRWSCRRRAARAGWQSPGRSAGPATSRSRHPLPTGEPARGPGAPTRHREPGRAAERPAPATLRPPGAPPPPAPRPGLCP